MEVKIREAVAGDYARTIVFYFELFHKQFNFGGVVKEYFIRAMADVFDDKRNSRLWVAVMDEKIVGTIAIVKKGEGEAQLRLFGVGQNLQGLGIGNKLMKIAMDFCKEKDFKHVVLWSIDILKSALHLYEKYGFYHTEDKPNDEWADYHIIEKKYEYRAD